MTTSIEVTTMPLRGIDMPCVQLDGQPWIPLKRAMEALGFDYPAQWRKLKTKEWAVIRQHRIPAPDGKRYISLLVDVQTMERLYDSMSQSRSVLARERHLGRRSRSGRVYYLSLIEDGKPLVKIGTTRESVEERYRVLAREWTRRPAQITFCGVLAAEIGQESVERQRHAQFADLRRHGEYFTISPRLLDHIEHVMVDTDFMTIPHELVDLAIGWADLFAPQLKATLIDRFREVWGELLDRWERAPAVTQ